MKQLYEIYEGYENVRKGGKKLFVKTRTANRDAYQSAMKGFRDLYEEDIDRVCAEAAASEDPASYFAEYGQRFMDEAGAYGIKEKKERYRGGIGDVCGKWENFRATGFSAADL